MISTKSVFYLQFAMLIIVVSVNSLHGGGGTSSTRNDACTGNVFAEAGSVCNTGPINLNKVGDKINYPTQQLTLTENFNVINAPITKTLAIPLPNQDFSKSAHLYAFTPTSGSRVIKNQPMKLLIVSYDLNNMPQWTPELVATEATNAKTTYPWAKIFVKFYRQLSGELATQWTELGSTVLDAAALADPTKLNLKIELQPDAKVTFFLPAHLNDAGKLVNEKPLIGDLGRLG